jgi:hypothetical protein
MSDFLREACDKVFQYPSGNASRRHGPNGYADYQSFKPWLRDEFVFRCAYCLIRERWEANGHHGFGVEHVQPQSIVAGVDLEYDNLVYSCNTCNSTRRDVLLPADVIAEPARHLQSRADGTVASLSESGDDVIEMCRLNRPLLVATRRRILNLIAILRCFEQTGAVAALRDLLSFPDDLPNLAALRPPGGNGRPEGVDDCFFERRERGDLPDFY